MIIGVDLGYGNTKATADGENVITFPSFVGSPTTRELSGVFGSSSKELDDLHIEFLESGITQGFFVGDLALRESRDVSATMDQEKIHHINTKVLLATAVLLTAGAAEEPIHLVTGLPLRHFAPQREDMKRMLSQIRIHAKGLGGPFKDVERVLQFSKVTIFPQAAGAVYYALLDESGQPRYPELMEEGAMIGLVDIGEGTTDVIVFQLRPKFRVLEAFSDTINLGIGTLKQSIRQSFIDQTRVSLDPMLMEEAIRKGRIWHKDRYVDLTRVLESTKQAIAKTILDHVKSRWGARADLMRAVFLAGGGAELLKNHLASIHADTRLVPNPQGANACGFWRVGNLAERREKPNLSLASSTPPSLRQNAPMLG